METILWILGTGAVIGTVIALFNKESPAQGAATGAFMAGSCMLQLIIPALVALAGLFLLKMILT